MDDCVVCQQFIVSARSDGVFANDTSLVLVCKLIPLLYTTYVIRFKKICHSWAVVVQECYCYFFFLVSLAQMHEYEMSRDRCSGGHLYVQSPARVPTRSFFTPSLFGTWLLQRAQCLPPWLAGKIGRPISTLDWHVPRVARWSCTACRLPVLRRKADMKSPGVNGPCGVLCG